MERVVHIAKSHEEAREWDRKQYAAMSFEERHAIAKKLKDKFYGTDCPDVREYHRNLEREK